MLITITVTISTLVLVEYVGFEFLALVLPHDEKSAVFREMVTEALDTLEHFDENSEVKGHVQADGRDGQVDGHFHLLLCGGAVVPVVLRRLV